MSAVMLDSLHRLMHRCLPPDGQGRVLQSWARRRGDSFKRSRDGTGYVVEGRSGDCPVRIEWGPPQRHYLQESELRVRIDTPLDDSAEILLISAELADRLEGQAYERLVQGQQTELSLDLPEEVRWLAGLRKVPLQAWPALQERVVVVSSMPQQAERWLDGEVAARLTRSMNHWLAPSVPLVLMLLRGRLVLRTEAEFLDDQLLDGLRGLAEAAMLSASLLDLRRQPLPEGQSVRRLAAPAAEATASSGAAESDLDTTIDSRYDPPGGSRHGPLPPAHH